MSTRDQNTFIVIAKVDGVYTLCTRRVFVSMEEACTYANDCAIDRHAMVIPGDFRNLRIDQGLMTEKVGYLMDGKIAICCSCGDKAHVLAHSENTELFRAQVYPYKQTCNLCGEVICEGETHAFAEIYSSARAKATLKDIKAVTATTPANVIRPFTQYAYVLGRENRDTDIEQLFEPTEGDIG